MLQLTHGTSPRGAIIAGLDQFAQRALQKVETIGTNDGRTRERRQDDPCASFLAGTDMTSQLQGLTEDCIQSDDFCSSGVASAMCRSSCQGVMRSFSNAARQTPAEFDIFHSWGRGRPDDNQPTCALQKFVNAQFPLPKATELVAVLAKPAMKEIYRALYAAEAVGCDFGATECDGPADCDSTEICVAGLCKDRCGDPSTTGFKLCDPCEETCSGGDITSGFCQQIEDNIPDNFDIFDTIINTLAMADPANPGQTCAAVADFFVGNDVNQIVSGTVTIPAGASAGVDGPCTRIEKDSEAKVVGDCPKGGGNVTVVEFQPNPNGECVEEVLRHTIPVSEAGDICLPAQSELDADVKAGLLNSGVAEADLNAAFSLPYFKARCVADGVEVSFSPNDDCSPTPGGFSDGLCAAAGNFLDADSCCLASLQLAYSCLTPHVADTPFNDKHYNRVLGACDKPGNTGVCPKQETTDLFTTCPTSTTMATQIVLGVDAAQVAAWNSLSEGQQKAAISLLFGARRDAIDAVTVSDADGTVTLDINTNPMQVARLKANIEKRAVAAANNVANSESTVGATVQDSNGNPTTIGFSSSKISSAVSGAAASAPPKVAAAVAVLAAAAAYTL